MTVYVREDMTSAGNWERHFARALFRELRPTLRQVGKESLQPLRMRTIRQEAVHTSRFGRSWKFKTPNKWTLVVHNTAKNPRNKFHYGLVIEGGRRRGARMPPPKELERWVQDKMPSLVDAIGVKSAAFLVARSIMRNGIRARPIMSAPKMQTQMNRNLTRKLSKMWDRAAEKSRLAPKPRKPRDTASAGDGDV